MRVFAERDMSAPPEVVFNTAIDPARRSAWLPAQLADQPPAVDVDSLQARYGDESFAPGCAFLQVRGTPTGGATVQFNLVVDPAHPGLTETAERSLACLAWVVADNLTAG